MGLKPIRVVALGAAVGCGALILALKAFGVEGEPTRDVVTEGELPVWTGAISTAGLLVWGAVAGGAGIVGLALLREQGDRETGTFLLVTAAGIGFLGLDDALLLHEHVLPEEIGIPQRAVYLMLAVLAVLWVVRFRGEILKTDLFLLGFMVLGFGLASAADVFYLWSTAGEDWLKYVGLAGLAGWVADSCLTTLSARGGQGAAPGPPRDEAPNAPRPTRVPAGATPPPER